MPNGGSDCCGTCWFNARNQGRAGLGATDDSIPNYCQVRSLEIRNAFYTYCGNHPHRRPHGDPIPIGPVLVVGHPEEGTTEPQPPLVEPSGYGRKVWQRSPDSEEIRRHLLELLTRITEQPADEYPTGTYTDELVVWQLGQFKEARAVPDLRRVLTFSPAAATERPFRRTRESLIAAAKSALAAILAHESTST